MVESGFRTGSCALCNKQSDRLEDTTLNVWDHWNPAEPLEGPDRRVTRAICSACFILLKDIGKCKGDDGCHYSVA